MPPKKPTTLLTSEHMMTISPLSEFYDVISENYENAGSSTVADTLISLRNFLTNKGEEAKEQNIEFTEAISKLVIDQIEELAAKVSRKNSKEASKGNLLSSSTNRAIKEEVQEPEEMDTEVVTSTLTRMERDDSPIRSDAHQIEAATTDEEMEDILIPSTVLRIQQMKLDGHTASPSKFVPDVYRSPKRTLRPPSHATPGRGAAKAALAKTITGDAENAKTNHATELKQMYLDQKVMKAKLQEERRKAVKERKEEIERKNKEKLEERRRKEERAAEFSRIANSQKSPPRVPRKVETCAKTPLSKNLKSVFNNESNGTPGRRPAKFGRVERLIEGETVAHPTVVLSPSREPQRNVKRVKPVISEMPELQNEPKPVLKAKRHQTPAKDDLIAAQEAYLLEEVRRKEAERIKLLDEERKKETMRLIQEKEQAARNQDLEEKRKLEEEQKKREESEKWLAKVQKEEDERLRLEAEKEKQAYEAAIVKQANKKVLDEKKGKLPVDCYEMTPPRVYVAPSKDDYGLDDLNSDDETDQEDDPRKEVPAWADWAVVRRNVRDHQKNPPFDVDLFFKQIQKPDLKKIFGNNVHVKKRGSSAVWKSPLVTGQGNKSIFERIREE